MRRTLSLVLMLWAAPALAQQGTPVPSIIVQGEATTNVAPDAAIISLGVVTERPRAPDAAAANSIAVQAVIDAIKAEGIAPRDIETTSISLSPIYDEPSQGAPKATGFRAGNELQIRVTPVEKAGPLAGRLIDKGVNAIEGIEFVASPDAQRRDRLRADAMRDARHQAEVYVEALGLKLGRVLAVSPLDLPPEPQLRTKRLMALAGAATAVPLAAGTQGERAAVSVTFEILQ